MMLRRSFWMLPLLLGLSSCALLSTSKPDRIFALTPLTANGTAARPNLRIVVGEPTALRVLDTERIANRSGELEFQYYTGAVWEDRAPDLLQHLLIESLRNRLGAVVLSDELTVTGTPLTSTLDDFQIEPGNQVHVTLVVTYGSSTRTFEVREVAASDKMVDLVAAFDVAVHQVLEDVVGWVAGS